jgi:hypothetical protein
VSLGVAKDQRLSLNPTQISGACGRLMCSLRYEHEFYVQARRRFPKEGKTVRTSTGEERVVSNDIFRERVVLRHVEGETRTIALAQLLQEIEAAGGTITPAATDRSADRREGASPAAAHRRDAVARSDASSEVEDDSEGVIEDDEEAELSPPSAAAIAADTAASHSDAPAPQGPGAEPSDRGDRRPHRRRGRRGGRRNRGGRREGNGGQPPPGAERGNDRGPSGDPQ